MPYNAENNELEILKYWDEHKCFEKSVAERPEEKPYVFYDGPPFATGLPHYGHIVASLMKDVVPRYFTMRGFKVERRWGWDCHGLPIENIIEQKLNLGAKRDIEEYGIAKFNEECRATVLMYAEEWKKTIKRMGRWVDMSARGGSAFGGGYGHGAYLTMDIQYMESLWWVFRQLWDRNLIYKGHKAMHICPRCVTPLSNFEVTQGYKTVKDLSVIAKFPISNFQFPIKSKFQISNDKPVYILAWTTTPWTLPGNVLLAVNENIGYWILDIEGEEGLYVVVKDRVEAVMKDKKYTVVKEVAGADLVGLEYEPLFPYYADTPNAFRVVAGDFVSTEDGAGVVHIAPAFGEDDYSVGQREGLPLVQHVTMEGKFKPEVTDFAGMDVKPKDDPTRADVEIVKWLARNGKLFSKEKFEHSYPHCWRCDTPLLNYTTTSWFVKVIEMKEQLLKNNKQIRWVPEHIKEGRFGKWLEGARDWAISRNRFWGTPLPVWLCQTENPKSQIPNPKCDNVTVVGSVEELEQLSGQKITDLHKHKIDDIVLTCKKCGGEMRRVPEVLDVWFESGGMPYGQMHYPFENKEKFEAGFPAEFIAEGQDQTRGWFYTLHVLATALTCGESKAIPKSCSVAFKNVIVNGIVLAEDGKKMSKRLKNYPEPDIILRKFGADAMRYYLITSPVMQAESLNFFEAGVREMYNKVVNTLWNVVEFYKIYADCHSPEKRNPCRSRSYYHNDLDPRLRGDDILNVLDKWALSKLQLLVKEVTVGMEAYKLVDASRPILDFITELSQWYLRRSRDRFKGDDEADKAAAGSTLGQVLLTLSKVMAPFTPFIAEKIYLTVGANGRSPERESVHLEMWPEADEKLIDEDVLKQMDLARKVVEMGLALRAEKGVRVRQPLNTLHVSGFTLQDEYKTIIADELNVKEVMTSDKAIGDDNVAIKEEAGLTVGLDTTITENLRKEGLAREVIRTINQLRKEQKLTIKDVVTIEYHTDDKNLQSVLAEYNDEIKKNVLAKKLVSGQGEGAKVEVDGSEMVVKINLCFEK